jgi:hypothetical protein
MAERPNAGLLKSLGTRVLGGSNPSPSAGWLAGWSEAVEGLPQNRGGIA